MRKKIIASSKRSNGSNGGNGKGVEADEVRTEVSHEPSPASFPYLKETELLTRLAGLGLTNEEMADIFGVSINEFNKILHDNPTLYDLLLDAKEIPNRKVEAALFRRALGYQVREVHKVEGKPVKVVIKEVAPDVVADIFWLKNRDPKRWRDTLEIQHTLKDRMDRAHNALRYDKIGKALELPYTGPREEGSDEDVN